MKLRQKLNVLAVGLIATALFSGCSQDQSSISINDIQGKAKIIGNLSYSEGQTYEGGKFVELVKPAAEKKVYVEVSNASLSPNGSAQGYTLYETVTDAEGNYEIEVPAVAKTAGTSVTIRTEDFVGKRQLLYEISEQVPVFKATDVVFTCNEKTESLKPNQIKVADMKYGFKERELLEEFKYDAPLRIKVGRGVLNWTNGANEPSMVATSNINVIVTVTYPNEEEGDPAEPLVRKYGATTVGTQGEFTLNIPVKEKSCALELNIKAVPFLSNDFNYYVVQGETYDTKQLSGLYKQYAGGAFQEDGSNEGTVQFDGIAGVSVYREVRMVFEPFAGHNTNYAPTGFDWSGAIK